MKLYNIVVNDIFSGEPFSFNAVGENITFSDALELAKDYLDNEGGYDADTNDLEVIECYAVTEVDGYKIKLVKE